MINNMATKTTSVLQVIIAGFLSFLATLSTAQFLLYFLWLVGKPNPTYQLATGIISAYLGLIVGGWITTRVLKSEDMWYAAINGLLVGGAVSYLLLGWDLLTLVSTILSFVFSGMGGLVAIQTSQPAAPQAD